MITSAQEYITHLKEIQESGNVVYTTIPSTEPRLFIDANTREIAMSSKFPFLAVKHDHRAETIYFEINRYFDDDDLVNHACIIQYINKSKTGEVSEGYYYVQEMDIESIEGKIIFGWTIENPATKFDGDIIFSVRFYSINDNDEFIYNFNTKPAHSIIEDTLQVCSRLDYLYPSDFDIWVSKIDEIANKITEAKKDLANTIRETTEQANIATNKASIATEQASIATTKATTATEQANVAINKANVATEKANVATTQASTATEKANIATTQAGIATENANAVLSKIDLTIEKANTATEQANIATTQASIATTQAENASRFADGIEDYYLMAQSYAIGGSGKRENEDVDNSKYYYEQVKAIATSLGHIANIDIASVEEIKTFLEI